MKTLLPIGLFLLAMIPALLAFYSFAIVGNKPQPLDAFALFCWILVIKTIFNRQAYRRP